MDFLLQFLVALGAILAALYAYKAVEEAKKQNDIARLDKQLDLYDALRDFRIAISEGPDYPDEKLWKFYRAAQLSEFYFTSDIYDEYGDIHNHAHETKGRAVMLPLVEKRNTELIKRCTDLSEKVRSFIKKTNPNPVN